MRIRASVLTAARVILGTALLGAVVASVWILVVHPERVKFAKGDEDDDEREVMAEVPVTLGAVSRATLRRYVEGYGTVEAEPGGLGKAAASARLASPVSGLVAEVHCFQGQRVEQGALLFQLDERSARAEEEKSGAAVRSAQAALDRLKSIPRPDQVKVAEMQVDRAKRSVEYSRKKNERVAKLLADQLASEKSAQETELELRSAENDLAIAEKQLALLKATPTPEEVAEAQSKIVEAEKALAAAATQRSLLKIRAPLSGTIVRARVNPGEAVDLSTALAEIVDLDRLVVEAAIAGSSVRSVAAGMAVELRAGGEDPKAARPANPLLGKVAFVGMDVDRKMDTGLVRISLPAKSGLAVGQFMRARIVVEEHKDCLVVPRESVVQTPDGKTAIVGFLGEKAIQKEVRVLLKEGDWVEVQGEEIDEGDRIVTRGAYGLPGEAKVRVEGKK